MTTEQSHSNQNAEQGGNASSKPVPNPVAVKKDAHSEQEPHHATQKLTAYQQPKPDHDWVDYSTAVAGGVQGVVAIGALVMAVIAGKWAKRAAEVASDNLRAFSTIEDAHLLVTFMSGHHITGTVDLYSLAFSIKNVGRSTALLRQYQVSSDDPILVDVVLEPGKTWNPQNRIHVHKTEGVPAVMRMEIIYSTALSDKARSISEGPILIDTKNGEPWVIIRSTKRET